MFEALGNFLRLRREARNLTKEAVADLAGISRQQVAQMEKGENMTLRYLVKVSRVLELTDVPIADLRLRASAPELDAIVIAADAIALAKRAFQQVDDARKQLDEASAALDLLMERALSSGGPTAPIEAGARRMLGRAGESGKVASELRELATPDGPARRKRAEPVSPAVRRRVR